MIGSFLLSEPSAYSNFTIVKNQPDHTIELDEIYRNTFSLLFIDLVISFIGFLLEIICIFAEFKLAQI